MRYSLLLLWVAPGLLAQSEWADRISVGFKAGSPLNDPDYRNFATNYKQSRWTGGPTIELHLPYNFSIEFDALYRSYDMNTTTIFRFDQTVSSSIGHSSQNTRAWDLPLLLKYRFRVRSIRPFISAGYLFTRESTEENGIFQCLGPQGSCTPPAYPLNREFTSYHNERSEFRKGPTGAVGLEFRTRYVTISPEVRFSRYLNGYPHENRLTGLVGFSFGGKD